MREEAGSTLERDGQREDSATTAVLAGFAARGEQLAAGCEVLFGALLGTLSGTLLDSEAEACFCFAAFSCAVFFLLYSWPILATEARVSRNGGTPRYCSTRSGPAL